MMMLVNEAAHTNMIWKHIHTNTWALKAQLRDQSTKMQHQIRVGKTQEYSQEKAFRQQVLLIRGGIAHTHKMPHF